MLCPVSRQTSTVLAVCSSVCHGTSHQRCVLCAHPNEWQLHESPHVFKTPVGDGSPKHEEVGGLLLSPKVGVRGASHVGVGLLPRASLAASGAWRKLENVSSQTANRPRVWCSLLSPWLMPVCRLTTDAHPTPPQEQEARGREDGCSSMDGCCHRWIVHILLPGVGTWT